MTDAQVIGERWRTRIILPRDKTFHEQMVLEAAYGTDEAAYKPHEKAKTIAAYTDKWGQSWDHGKIVMGEDFSSVGAAWGRRIEVISEARAAHWPLPAIMPEIALAVVPEKRGMGAGTVAIKSVMRDYRDMGIPGVGLHVLESNSVAQRLYKAVGFEAVAICDYRDGSREQRGFIMAADLDRAPID